MHFNTDEPGDHPPTLCSDREKGLWSRLNRKAAAAGKRDLPGLEGLSRKWNAICLGNVQIVVDAFRDQIL